MARSPDERERLYSDAATEFGAALERLARAYERDSDRRRDLLQEIHVALWRSFARFDGRCSIRTWVYRVAHNVATSRVIRARSHSPAFATSLDLESIPDSRNTETQLDRQWALARVYELIYELKPIDRQIMLLYLEEVDAAAIADITGLTAVYVATKVHRLKQVLARRFHAKGVNHE